MQCCKHSKVCVGKKCKSKLLWCKWKGQSHFYKVKKVCQMLPIKQNKFVIIKRKQCTLWSKKCEAKKGCKIAKIKTFWYGKKNYYKKIKKMFSSKLFKKI